MVTLVNFGTDIKCTIPAYQPMPGQRKLEDCSKYEKSPDYSACPECGYHGATADDEAGNVGEIEGVADSYPDDNVSAEGVLDESLPPSADDAVPVDGG